MHIIPSTSVKKGNEVLLWRDGLIDLWVRLRPVSADQRWNSTRGRRHVGTWIGLFYEDLVEQILGSNANISTASKVTNISCISERAKEIEKPSPPDVFVGMTDGSAVFLEIKSSAPRSGWPVIYRDQLDAYARYEEMWSPVFFVFIEHPIERSQDRFRRSLEERRVMAQELRNPHLLSVLPASVVRNIYLSTTSQEIVDKRMYNRPFRRIRSQRIAEASAEFSKSFPVKYLTIRTSLLAGFTLQP